MRATYALADLHGRFDLLSRALDLIEEADGIYSWPTKVIVLGDFVDRGPQSRAVIDLLIDMQSRPSWEVIAIGMFDDDQAGGPVKILSAVAKPQHGFPRPIPTDGDTL